MHRSIPYMFVIDPDYTNGFFKNTHKQYLVHYWTLLLRGIKFIFPNVNKFIWCANFEMSLRYLALANTSSKLREDCEWHKYLRFCINDNERQYYLRDTVYETRPERVRKITVSVRVNEHLRKCSQRTKFKC